MLPDSAIELRPFETADASTVAKLVGDKTVSKWTSNIPFPYSEKDAADWINATADDPTKNPFAVELNGKLVACVCYWPHENNGFEVGYWVGKSFRGKGVGTEALRLLLSARDFPTCPRVFAKVMVQNIGSQRVLEKCGFTFQRNGLIVTDRRKIESKFYVRSQAT